MMTDGDTLDIGDFPEYIRSREPSAAAHHGVVATLAEVEKAHVLRVLETVQGNKMRAAELLGISRAKLYRVLADSQLEDGSNA
jgi:transcriptional regulator of acetoin/glycerol metabolism